MLQGLLEHCPQLATLLLRNRPGASLKPGPFGIFLHFPGLSKSKFFFGACFPGLHFLLSVFVLQKPLAFCSSKSLQLQLVLAPKALSFRGPKFQGTLTSEKPKCKKRKHLSQAFATADSNGFSSASSKFAFGPPNFPRNSFR